LEKEGPTRVEVQKKKSIKKEGGWAPCHVWSQAGGGGSKKAGDAVPGLKRKAEKTKFHP